MKTQRTGFTLIELLVVIAIIAILSSLLLPALSRAKARAGTARCTGNLRQLHIAWRLYVDDYDETMPMDILAPDGGNTMSLPGSWVVGNAQTDSTTSNIQAGVLYPYVNAVEVYRCPSDRALVRGTSGIRHSRSYAQNLWLNGDPTQNGFPPSGLKPYLKTKASQIINPSAIFCQAEPDEKSIDSGAFAVTQAALDPKDADSWWDMPSDRHNQGANLSFLDGHVELARWGWPKRFKKHLQPVASPAEDPQRRDLQDLRRVEAAIPEN